MILVLALSSSPARPDESVQPTRPKDAAEEVQEGDVEHWIKYYQRERGQGTPPAPQPEREPPAQPDPKPGPQR
jgi:hypothetical protein